MRDELTPPRRPAEHTNRTTRRGADQYVLACNARREATDLMFANIERIEDANGDLRKDIAWKRRHGTTRTNRWVTTRMLSLTYLVAFAASLAGWLFTAHGREARVDFILGMHENEEGPRDIFSKPHWIISDIPQQAIDSIVAATMSRVARRGY